MSEEKSEAALNEQSENDDFEFREKWKQRISLDISDDAQIVKMLLYDDFKEERYEKNDIIRFLRLNHIVCGIDENRIDKILKHNIREISFIVAKGIKTKDGKDGYFEFFFDREPTKKPIILEDGSVDYNKLGIITLCKKDDLLVRYHKAVEGTKGIDVFGNVFNPTPVKELPPLRGRGIYMSEDKTEYYASDDGRIEYYRGELILSKVIEIDGNIDAVSGNLEFNGDIIIKGNVIAGTVVRATGSITVNGHVETATLIADKEILLRNGMQGSEKGEIIAGGDVFAKFFELSKVSTEGNINANAIMNCEIKARGNVIVSGRRGKILGGTTDAFKKIEAYTIGNSAEKPTVLKTGMREDYNQILQQLEEEKQKIKKEMAVIDPEYDFCLPFDDVNPQKRQLIYAFNEINKQQEAILKDRLEAADSCIVVRKTVYPNTTVIINGCKDTIAHKADNITIKEVQKEIKYFSNF